MKFPMAVFLGFAGGLLLTAAPAPELLPARALKRAAFAPGAEQLRRHQQALAAWHGQFDEQESMLRVPFSSPGYHTTLKGGMVHPTRTSLEYAVALLDSLEDRWLERAEAILMRVIGLQEQDPAKPTYGIWPWFLEEPLERMSPPDWNWADFCGRLLLQVALDHRSRLSPKVRQAVDAAIQHAARSIKKRNVGPGYTNIAIMGTYVTLMAGELYDWPEMQEYARARWRAFVEHTRRHGSFNEYNSPTYTVVAIEELGRLLKDAPEPRLRESIAEIYHLAWEEVALHFHPPTRQWAGPHSRSYRTLLGEGTLAFLQRATRLPWTGVEDKPSPYEIRLSLPCPDDLVSCFERLEQAREVRRQFVAGDSPIIGTTWLHPAFALGSVNRGDFWNQRRSVVAYWGTVQAPAYLHLRVLHDDYDFAAAQCFAAQREGRLLVGIIFATDGGDTHISLDRIQGGRIQARDLRLRLEFGGTAAGTPPCAPQSLLGGVQWQSGALHLSLQAAHAQFGGQTLRWSAGSNAQRAWLDLELFRSPADKVEVDLNALEAACVILALEMSDRPVRPAACGAAVEKNGVQASWGDLRLDLPLKPAPVKTLQAAARAHRQPGRQTETRGAP